MTPGTEGWMPCSDRSAERGDPLPGSAGVGERWFLVEIDGAWGAHAFLQSRLDPALGRRLVRRIESAGIRPLAIRRTGRKADERRQQAHWRWAAIDARPGRESVRWGSVDDPQALLEVPLDGSTGVASSDPVICVCTHARHDQCCAVKGRSVVTALAKRHPTLTWECSHLGGDRFAATLILFPHGLHYGRVPAADAPQLVDRYGEGHLVERYLRGRASLPNPVQAAQSFARDALGETRIETLGTLAASATDGEWTIVLDHDGVPVTVVVRETVSDPILSTCAATRFSPVREYTLRSVSGPSVSAATQAHPPAPLPALGV